MSDHTRPLAAASSKPVIRNFEKRKVYSSFKDNIWVADLAVLQLISKFNKRIHFYNVLLVFITNMHGWFFWKTQNENAGMKITNTSKKIYTSLIAKQIGR